MVTSTGAPFKILALDGGGAKGFYTLGVLKEIEAMIGCPIHQRFDLIFGTSTGAIIAALLSLGRSVDDIEKLYRKHIVAVMARWLPCDKTAALRSLASEIFAESDFTDVKTHLGIVATNWGFERPFIFKADAEQAYRRKGTFVPGFGVKMSDAVEASCSAFPFFYKKPIVTSAGEKVLLVDGGFCANNPTLYAIADATGALEIPRDNIRVVSIGVGEYPAPRRSIMSVMRLVQYLFTVRFLQKTMEINTQSMDQLRKVLFSDIPTVRINDRYTEPEMATDMFEHDLLKLGLLWSRGRESFEQHEGVLRQYLM